jgi:hypothetical protein
MSQKQCVSCGKTENREVREIEDFGFAILDDVQMNKEGTQMECLECIAQNTQ